MSSLDSTDRTATSTLNPVFRGEDRITSSVHRMPAPTEQTTPRSSRHHIMLVGNWVVFHNVPAHFAHLPGHTFNDLHDALHELSVEVRDTLEGGIAIDVRIAPQSVLGFIDTYRLTATPRAITALKDAAKLNWQEQALCKEADPEIFFPDKGGPTASAKRLCQTCSVRQECLEYALENDERYGVWGGKSERERRKLKSTHNTLELDKTPAVFPVRRVG